VLAKKHGGRAAVHGRRYCRFYTYRPNSPPLCLLCSGAGMWPHCPDYDRCLQNPPSSRERTGGLQKMLAGWEGQLFRKG